MADEVIVCKCQKCGWQTLIVNLVSVRFIQCGSCRKFNTIKAVETL